MTRTHWSRGGASAPVATTRVVEPIENSETIQERVQRLAQDAAPDQPALDRYLADVCPP